MLRFKLKYTANFIQNTKINHYTTTVELSGNQAIPNPNLTKNNFFVLCSELWSTVLTAQYVCVRVCVCVI